MKKLTFKISRGLKTALVISSLMGIAICAVKHTTKANAIKVALVAPFVGTVATMKSKKKWDALPEDMKSFLESQDEVMKAIHDEKETLKEEVEKLKSLGEAIPDDLKTKISDLEDTAKKQAEELVKLKNQAGEAKGFDNVIAKALESSKSKIADFRAKKEKHLSIEVKATQTSADIGSNSMGTVLPDIGQIPVRKAVIEPLFPAVNTNSETIYYYDQNTVVRDAKNVAGCASSSHNTKVTWQRYNISMTKVRDFVDICLDMLEDYAYVAGEIRNLIETSVTLKVDLQTLKGTGADAEMASVDLAASEFSAANTLDDTIEAWTGKVQEPNIFDLTIAMASQIVALGEDNSYMPNVAVWNTLDKYKSMLVKDKNNNYLLPPFVVKVGNTEYTIDDMKVVTSPICTANTCYVFDSTKGTLYNRRGITVEMSYENNDNFEREIVTTKAYRRMNLLIRNVNKNAFMKCSDVTAALVSLKKAE